MLFSAIQQHESVIGIHMSPHSWTLVSPPTLLGCHRATDWSFLHHPANFHRLSVSHMVIYVSMLLSIHPTHCVQVYSLCLCLHCCPADRLISTIFLDSILLFSWQSCPTLRDPMDCSMPGFPAFTYLLEFCSNSCPLSWWCHPTISSSVTPFSSCPQSFPASGSFPVSQLFTSGGQSIRASASASVLSMNIQGRFPLGLTGLISLQFKGLSRVFSSDTIWKHQFSHIHTWQVEKPSLWLYGPLLAKWCLCFVILYVYHSFSSMKKINQFSFNFMAAVTIYSDFGTQGNKICHYFHFFHICLPWRDGNRCHDLSFLNVEF